MERQMTSQAQTKRFSWKDAPDLMAILGDIQNEPRNQNRDIMTFAGFMSSREELEVYVLGHAREN
jgi:hypothetical protein